MAKRLEEILAVRVRELARERQMPISHVADRCGLAHSYFWQVLAAKASPSLAVVQRLASALEVEPLELLVQSESQRAIAAEKSPHERARAAPTSPRSKRRASTRK